ncbi:MAG: hypothetical protein AAFN92_12180 [Bacteroidota bacterium]
MKVLFYLTLLLGSIHLCAQTDYQQRLGQTLGQLAQAESATDYGQCATAFANLSTSTDASWHANYYLALSKVAESFRTEGADERDLLVDEAQEALDAAEEAGAEEVEVTALQARVQQARISVDAENRTMQIGPSVLSMLFSARAKSPNHPRILFLLGQTVARTPAAYGGGQEKAFPLVQASVTAFENWQSADPFAPQWGASEAAALLQQLNDTKSRKK